MGDFELHFWAGFFTMLGVATGGLVVVILMFLSLCALVRILQWHYR